MLHAGPRSPQALTAVTLAVNLGLKTGVAPSSVRLAHDVVWLAHYDVKPFKLCLEAVISSTQVHRQSCTCVSV